MAGLLGNSQGLLGARPTVRQVQTPGNQGQQSSLMSAGSGGQGGAPAPGTDEYALMMNGPNGLLWRQVIAGMAGPGGGLNILDPNLASQFFTADTIGGLAPKYQEAFAKQSKGKK